MEKGVKEDNSKKIDFIKWFSELNKDSGKFVGGKGANLGEIYGLKVGVPPGFVVTAQAYDYFIEKANIDDQIKKLLSNIDYENTNQLTETTKKIRELIEKSHFPKEMEEEIIESYENLDTEGHDRLHAQDMLKKISSNEPFVAVRSSATTEDLAEASFAGQQDTYLNVKGKTDLLNSIRKCFASLFTTRATYYRNKKGFKHEQASLAVIVQKMVDSDKSGVIFSKDPSMARDDIIIEAVWGLGEGIVSGRITPDRYVVSKESEEFKIKEKEINKKKIAITRDSSGSKEIVKLNDEISERQVLKDHEVIRLAEIAIKLEDHYEKPQDIEFAIENSEIYIVQTRPITTIDKRSEVDSGKELKGEIILKGLAASPGIGSGKVRIVNEMSDLEKVQQGDILVTKMTNPDMVVTMQKSAAIVTDEGGLTAHASIVSREMGIPAVVGTQEATTKLKDEEIITVNGSTGNIYKGKVADSKKKEIIPVTAQTKTRLKLIVDLPSFAERASKTGIKSVGLARIEGIIAESGKHPISFIENNNQKGYEDLIYKGISQTGKYFEELWIRTSDIRSDEFGELEGSPKEKEANPMLGMHGIRYSLKNPQILKAELNAMKRLSEEGKTVGILIPQVISIDDVRKVKDFSKEIGFSNAKMGVMIETPASVQIIRELCEEGIDFISFGTNDLTQYTLAVDRGNQQVQELYDELHPAVLHQIEYVIRTCRRNNVETSICGQAGSKKEMVKFLVKQKISSISLNADVAADIAQYISSLENGTPYKPQEDNNQKNGEVQENQGTEASQEQAAPSPGESIESAQETASDAPAPEATQEASYDSDPSSGQPLEEIKENRQEETEEVPGLKPSNNKEEDENLDIF